jgi:hypothetical protein
MSKADDKLIKILIPPELTLADKNYNPAYDIPQYEWKTVAQYKEEKRLEWLEQHRNASALVVNQEGTPLYALYTSPYGSNEEAVHQLFKHLRAIKLNEWEEELDHIQEGSNK